MFSYDMAPPLQGNPREETIYVEFLIVNVLFFSLKSANLNLALFLLFYKL